MPNARAGAVGALLAIVVGVAAPWASAQVPGWGLRNRQSPVQKIRYEETTVLSEAHQRLEELKVELALLSDVATFAYYLGARVRGETLELRGYVPNDLVRQRALELARRATFLTVKDEMRIQPNLSLRPPLRPALELQQEGIKLLQKNVGEPAKQMSLRLAPNGVVVLTGRIDSVESKREISRLFRQLPGCFGVVNELTVEQIVRDGQLVVQVTRDGSLVVPSAALGQEEGSLAAPLPLPASPSSEKEPSTPASQQPAILPPPSEKEPSTPASQQPSILPPPKSLPAKSLDAQQGELHLPTAVPPKQPSTPSKPTPPSFPRIGGDKEKGSVRDTHTAPKLPVKWGRPAESWESQVNKLEMVHAPPAPATPPAVRQQAEMPPLDPVASRPAETKWIPSPSAESTSSQASTKSRPNTTQTQTTPAPTMTWRHPSAHEESEPKDAPPVGVAAVRERPANSRPDDRSPVNSARRWPPAYESRPPDSQGRPGVIIFDDDPPSPPTPLSPPKWGGKEGAGIMSRPIEPVELQRRIQALCGRQAREVAVARQLNGTLVVKVKVANSSIEDQLSRKILAIPEMNSSQVRLLMEVQP